MKNAALSLVILGLVTIPCVAEPIVGIETPMGNFYLELLDQDAPASVANFLNYLNDGDYTGTFFHRSVPSFVVQGGGFFFDPVSNSAPGISVDPPVVNEFKISNTGGTIAMAKSGGDPDSATSQWFVNLADNSGNLDSQNGGFTVFARILDDGMDVIDAIASLDRYNLGAQFDTTPMIDFDQVTLTAENFVTIDSIKTYVSIVAPVAAVLPGARSIEVGQVATAFTTIINVGTSSAAGCSVSPVTEVTASFSYQATDSSTNAAIGEANPKMNIEAGAFQTLVFSFTPTQVLTTTEIELQFKCLNSDAALSLSSTNTFTLSAAAEPVADVIALVATLNNDGIVHIPGVDGVGFFTMASVNVGASQDLFVTASLSDIAVPVTLSICETNPLTAVCINPTTPTQDPVSLNMATNATPTFAIFLSATGQSVTLDPAYKRVGVQFSDDQGILRGATSVALETSDD
jgi:peptidyl-prolyl cis-trans isomerase A (cyclophilin A)